MTCATVVDELLAIVVPYLSEPELFRGREVVHFVDNTSAIYSAIKGYSSSRDSARIVHILHCVLAALGVTLWLEYVPSKENPSDAPSREDFDLLEALGGCFVCPAFPPAASMVDPARAWEGLMSLSGGRRSRAARLSARRMRIRMR